MPMHRYCILLKAHINQRMREEFISPALHSSATVWRAKSTRVQEYVDVCLRAPVNLHVMVLNKDTDKIFTMTTRERFNTHVSTQSFKRHVPKYLVF